MKIIFLCIVLTLFSVLIGMDMQDYDFEKASAPFGYFRTTIPDDGCLNSREAEIAIIPLPGKSFYGFGRSIDRPSNDERGIAFQPDQIFFKIKTKIISLAVLIAYLEDEKKGSEPYNKLIEDIIFAFFRNENHHHLKNRQELSGLTYKSVWQIPTEHGYFVPLFIARDDL